MKTRIFIATILLAGLSMSAMAQNMNKKFSFELRTGASFATQKLGDVKLKPGIGFEGTFDYKFLNNASAYVGWGWNKFASDEGNEIDFEETGYVFGLQYQKKLGSSPSSLFLRAGGIYNHIEVENEEGDIISDSGHGLGWQLLTGVNIPLNSSWNLRPSIKYQSLSREVEMSDISKDVNLNYVSFGVGISKSF